MTSSNGSGASQSFEAANTSELSNRPFRFPRLYKSPNFAPLSLETLLKVLTPTPNLPFYFLAFFLGCFSFSIAMADAVEAVDPFVLEVDVDYLFQGLPDDFNFDLDLDFSTEIWTPVSTLGEPNSLESIVSVESPPTAESDDTPEALSAFACEIEKFLMEDGGEGDERGFDDGFFSNFVIDGSDDSGTEVASRKSEVAEDSDGKEKVDAFEMADVENKREASLLAADEEEGDDPIAKKRRRQMRNRDSAMKSRERKKMYLKDLEMKSKYLEAECRRLNYALQFCMAENTALHQRLQKERPVGVRAAKQESAVLFVESLLLGSLFWLMSIVCLFLVPSLQTMSLKETNRLGRGPTQEATGPKKVASKQLGPDLGHELVIMRKRCRGMRARMKLFYFSLYAVTA